MKLPVRHCIEETIEGDIMNSKKIWKNQTFSHVWILMQQWSETKFQLIKGVQGARNENKRVKKVKWTFITQLQSWEQKEINFPCSTLLLSAVRETHLKKFT